MWEWTTWSSGRWVYISISAFFMLSLDLTYIHAFGSHQPVSTAPQLDRADGGINAAEDVELDSLAPGITLCIQLKPLKHQLMLVIFTATGPQLHTNYLREKELGELERRSGRVGDDVSGPRCC
ncbi:hypothetical protein DE146DRAFT_390467 [Phaeosphaeria sp. MPI-PUGE-AT-0046c]|nr:hypothetical protein DE146DRAFT_390467 [Phaeosphaeria sp. MPI-PUGE-AT-0046c]